ncbi:MAG: Rieske 2Fe-2S domain-containing protein, partial [Pseudomonas sp.]
MSDQPIIRRRVVKHGISDARANNAKTQSQYQPYKDAAWGFINHWYPALFSEELAEDQVEGMMICGVPLVLRRVNGKVYCLKDQCLHRGVRLSEKPMCFNKSTISCWYHGFTFDLETGD